MPVEIRPCVTTLDKNAIPPSQPPVGKIGVSLLVDSQEFVQTLVPVTCPVD